MVAFGWVRRNIVGVICWWHSQLVNREQLVTLKRWWAAIAVIELFGRARSDGLNGHDVKWASFGGIGFTFKFFISATLKYLTFVSGFVPVNVTDSYH
ncbi:hypothetical protein [Spiroplasma poulsonii]|uniref:hypothetical protein n=1 Tax=Spiroplasma poulsonii TaxID=2138 RepID=UPI001F4D2A6B|nr:hypothetical protein [Spiroplasma poulsonii]UNF62706.1 hypothetical protein MNU24_08240 [Spiroplasma poulsonii]